MYDHYVMLGHELIYHLKITYDYVMNNVYVTYIKYTVYVLDHFSIKFDIRDVWMLGLILAMLCMVCSA